MVVDFSVSNQHKPKQLQVWAYLVRILHNSQHQAAVYLASMLHRSQIFKLTLVVGCLEINLKRRQVDFLALNHKPLNNQ